MLTIVKEEPQYVMIVAQVILVYLFLQPLELQQHPIGSICVQAGLPLVAVLVILLSHVT